MEITPELDIQNKIYEIRGQKIMLDFDLADLYSVGTKALNQAVKRNIKRFPLDFMFQLSESEWAQFKNRKLNSEPVTICDQFSKA